MNANVTKPHLHQDWIDPHAIGIVRALQKHNYTTYLVGGCVRDLLLNIQPKDFDIATDARPDQVKTAIHRAYIIGKRFRLVLVRRDDSQFEVATFRRDLRDEETRENLPDGDNIFGTVEEDAQRRDFTINALFYDPISEQLIDHAGGLDDLEARWIRMIGPPEKRLAEDPIRILRALRLKHMIGFSFEPSLREAMQSMANTLPNTVLPRRREEILKLLKLRHPDAVFIEAQDLGILEHLSPTLSKALDGPGGEDFLMRLRQIGQRSKAGMSPADLFGLLVHAYARSFLQPEVVSGPRARDAANDETFQTWMREELGMFKFEQALAVKALHVQGLLTRRKEFQAKGERRQRALLLSDAFPMALMFARGDYSLSCQDQLYWSDRFEELKGETKSDDADEDLGTSDARPKRRRARRPRRKTTGGEATSSSN